MSIFSTQTIKASRGKSVYKFKNSPIRIAQEATYIYGAETTDTKDFMTSIENIMGQMKSLQVKQTNVLRLARLKVSSGDVVDLLPKARAVMSYIESMPDDISVDIPNARVYHNIESRGIGFHNIFIELKKEINGINELMTVLKNLSIGYKAPESEMLLKNWIENRPDYRDFSVDYISYFSSPVKSIDKSMIMNYVKDFFYMMDNYYNLIKNSSELACNSLNSLYESLSSIKQYELKPEIFNREDVKEFVDEKVNYIHNMYTNAVKYLYTYQISLEQRFDTDISAVNIIYNQMNRNLDAESIEDNSLDDEIEYGRFLGEASIINEADEPKKINTYLVKITNGLKVAWNKLNQKLEDGRKKLMEKFSGKLDEIDKSFDKINPDFKITNYPSYDFTRLDNIKVIALNYEEMKESLKSENDFIKKYYSNIPHDEKSNFKDDITKFVTTSKQDLQVTSETLHNMMKFVREGYDNHRKGVQTDIETINKANEAITNIAKNLKNENKDSNSIKVDTKTDNNTNTSTPADNTDVRAHNDSAIMYGNIITEKGENEKDKKPTFVDGNNKQGLDNGSDQSFTKDISVYMKVSSSIMSVKMKILKDHFMLCVNSIIHAAAPAKKTKEEKETEKKEKEEKK